MRGGGGKGEDGSERRGTHKNGKERDRFGDKKGNRLRAEG